MNRFYLLAFSLAVFCVGWFPRLPTNNVNVLIGVLALIGLCMVLLFSSRRSGLHQTLLKVVVCLSLGLSYGLLFAESLMHNKLAPELIRSELLVKGKIVGLTTSNADSIGFDFFVESAHQPLYRSGVQVQLPHLIHLSLFSRSNQHSVDFESGQRWQFLVKLKPVHGLVNFSVSDSDIGTLRRGVGAFGHIDHNGFNSGVNQLLEQADWYSIDGIRGALKEWIEKNTRAPQSGFLVTLAVGDTSLLTNEQWSDYLKTGTNHLIAISGLHVGFFALVGYGVGLFMGRWLQLLIRSVEAQIWAHIIAFGLTFGYCLIAGLNIPTVRTLIMLGVVQWSFVFRRNTNLIDSVFLALFIVSLYDPLAIFDRGFWLSFCAVGVLIFVFSGRYTLVDQATIPKWFRGFFRMQWFLTIGLLLPLLLLVSNVSLVAPLANFVATPLVTFVLVPLLLLAGIVHEAAVCIDYEALENVALALLVASENVASFTQFFLHSVLKIFGSLSSISVSMNASAFLLAFIGVILAILPKGIRRPMLGCFILFGSLSIPSEVAPPLRILVFDVGQGTSVLVRTPNHTLLYDTGPAYSNRSNAGNRVVVPYLQAEAIKSLDMIVLSHDDLDHTGGYESIAQAVVIDKLVVGQIDKWASANSSSPSSNCHEHLAWSWDSVRFEFVELRQPTSLNHSLEKDNNRSCILRVSYHDQSILLPGDIEKEMEAQLIEQGLVQSTSVVLAPHHGSHSSSSEQFVGILRPDWVIYSAAYLSQHGHPHRDIQDRYTAVGAKAQNTAADGAIEVTVSKLGELSVRAARESKRHYWYP